MKRYEALAPLSREHHGALILANLLKRNAPVYKGLPTTIEGKAEYAIRFYETELKGHFLEEEALLNKVKPSHPDIEILTSEIIAEHKTLQDLLTSLDASPDKETVLNELGQKLDEHIRKEERILFPLIQEQYTEDALNKLLS